MIRKIKKYLIKENITLNKPLILPKGFKLKVFRGVKILSKNNGFIYSKGPVELIGEIEKPILIKGSDGGMD